MCVCEDLELLIQPPGLFIKSWSLCITSLGLFIESLEATDKIPRAIHKILGPTDPISKLFIYFLKLFVNIERVLTTAGNKILGVVYSFWKGIGKLFEASFQKCLQSFMEIPRTISNILDAI